MYNPEFVLENEIHKILWIFFRYRSSTPRQKTRLNDIKGEITVLVYQRLKIKEREKKDKYGVVASELKELWTMRMTVIPLVTGVLGTVPKGFERGLEELEIRKRIGTILTTALLGPERILRRVLENWGYLLSVGLLWMIISLHWCEKLAKNIRIICYNL